LAGSPQVNGPGARPKQKPARFGAGSRRNIARTAADRRGAQRGGGGGGQAADGAGAGADGASCCGADRVLGCCATGCCCGRGFGGVVALRRGGGGGGATACNSTDTGFGTMRGCGATPVLGSTISVAAEMRTGTVCGWWPGSVKVVVNSLPVTASEHGVRQVCPVEVRASAPGGLVSNCTVVVGGPKPGSEKLGMLGMPEHPARAKPHAAMATVRFIDQIRLLLRLPTAYSAVSRDSLNAKPAFRPSAPPRRVIADKILLKCALIAVKGRLMPIYLALALD